MLEPFQEPILPTPRPMLDAEGPAKQVKYFLRLFVSGDTRHSRTAMENLRTLGAHLGTCDVEIVDIHENPAAAESAHVIATPTLLRDFPLPRRKIIGDLSDIDTILLILSV